MITLKVKILIPINSKVVSLQVLVVWKHIHRIYNVLVGRLIIHRLSKTGSRIKITITELTSLRITTVKYMFKT